MGKRLVRPERSNILVVVIDDLGIERMSTYPLGTGAKAPMRGLNALLNSRGVRFDQCRVPPRCSTMRESVLNGQFNFRTGVGGLVLVNNGRRGRLTTSTTVANVLSEEYGYATAHFGKWHLTNDGATLNEPLSRIVEDWGFDYADVTPRNLAAGGGSYYSWPQLRLKAGSADYQRSAVNRGGYATTDQANAVLNWVSSVEGGQPWYAQWWLNAPHVPYDGPPAHLFDPQDYPLVVPGERSGGASAEDLEYYLAMTVAADREFARVVRKLPADTVVIFIGDNGSPDDVIGPPFVQGQSKADVYEGGVRAPLVILSDDASPGGTTTVLAGAYDIAATVLDYAGVGGDGTYNDGRSLRPWVRVPATTDARGETYVEEFGPNHGDENSGVLGEFDSAIVRNASRTGVASGDRYKYIRRETGSGSASSTWGSGTRPLPEEELFNLTTDPYEQSPINLGTLSGDDLTAYNNLDARMDAILAQSSLHP